ncbi:MAG: hypothetical protein AUK48_09995 [Oscillatoriales cyanobacterium CG2_30_44_21]|nr:MAG: hypothetical protein AUK48_09995 [Oscillatoriales cyanobacterium CG2_30_44_21]
MSTGEFEKNQLGDRSSLGNWGVKVISFLTMSYMFFSLISPMITTDKAKQPKKLEAGDLALIALVLLFNSNLLNRLENFGVSTGGGITAKFKELDQEVNKQKEQIDDLQSQQLEQLAKQQKNLEEMQAFMYNFLITEKDYEKIDQLYKHLEIQTNYDCFVPEKVGEELRHLRDLKLISTKLGRISDIVRASEYGKYSVDLTQHLDVTDLGKKLLQTRQEIKKNVQTL